MPESRAYFQRLRLWYSLFAWCHAKDQRGESLNRRLSPLCNPLTLFVAQNSPNRFQRIRLRQNPALQSEINLPSANSVFFLIIRLLLKHIIILIESPLPHCSHCLDLSLFC